MVEKVYLIWQKWTLEDQKILCVVSNADKAKEITKQIPNSYIDERTLL